MGDKPKKPGVPPPARPASQPVVIVKETGKQGKPLPPRPSKGQQN